MIDTLNADVSTFQRSNVSTPTISDHAAPRFDPAATAFGAGVESADRLVPEETSGQVTLDDRASGPIESLVPATPAIQSPSDFPAEPFLSTPLLHRPARKPVTNLAEAEQRLLKLQLFRELITQGHTARQAAAIVGKNRSLLWKWEDSIKGLDLNNPFQRAEVLEKLANPLRNPAATRPQGRCSDWEPLLLMDSVKQLLYRLYAASIGASGDAMASDRRTGNMMATMQHFTTRPECPEGLRKVIQAGNLPICFKRYFGAVTPEIEAMLRGSKHATLYGFSGRRDKTIGLPDGRLAYQPANWKIELDDMSVNQPFWVDGPPDANGVSQPILSRQGLYARSHYGRWMACMLVSRVREAYTSADILRFIRKLCETYGKPAELVLEQSVWAAGNIKGYKLKPTGELELDAQGKPIEEDVERPAMAMADRKNLEAGLAAINIKITYVHTPRGKAVLEGGFRTLQTHLAMLTMEFNNIGRHAGEFENPAQQTRRVRAGSHHPRLVGFPHQSELLLKIQEAFDFLNSWTHHSRHPGIPHSQPIHWTQDSIFQADDARWPRPQLSLGDYDVFLPDRFEQTITNGSVCPQMDGRQLPFRAEEFAHLGDGFRVSGRCDRTEPSLGAAIYCRESTTGAKNRRLDNPLKAYAPGDFICWARQEVPGRGSYADSVPEGVPTWSQEQVYGAGAASDGGSLLKAQQKRQRLFVRTGWIGAKPGQPHVQTAEVRDGKNVARVERTAASPQPVEPALPASPRTPSMVAPSPPEEFSKAKERRSRQGAAARALLEASA